MTHPSKESFMVFSVCRIDFKGSSYDHIRFFKVPKDAELLRDDLNLKHAEDEGVMYIVEHCKRSEVS